MVVMLEPGQALVCEDALPSYALDILREHEIDIVPVSYADCVKLGGDRNCNVDFSSVRTVGSNRLPTTSVNTEFNEADFVDGDVVHGDTFDFRVYDGAFAALDTYPQTPRVTVDEPVTATPPSLDPRPRRGHPRRSPPHP